MKVSSVYRRPAAARAQVIATLQTLGVDASPAFVDFFAEYEGPFSSGVTAHQLCSLTDPGDMNTAIVEATRLAREAHGFATRFLVISDFVGGSVLVYDTRDDHVFNVDFEGGKELLHEGRLAPQFKTFKEFLDWYFAGESINEL